ncbi:hypothetical protein H2201_004317 [Coniosporium apollinis]|uniref:Uncharacterized protein n=1 Tax=Coniosporium apollinis TaxID=61459 RepID=A0ABQ9NT82_9PEZI|nr:hypothetical protein H2201_004317 [Coniosporium apollinis]
MLHFRPINWTAPVPLLHRKPTLPPTPLPSPPLLPPLVLIPSPSSSCTLLPQHEHRCNCKTARLQRIQTKFRREEEACNRRCLAWLRGELSSSSSSSDHDAPRRRRRRETKVDLVELGRQAEEAEKEERLCGWGDEWHGQFWGREAVRERMRREMRGEYERVRMGREALEERVEKRRAVEVERRRRGESARRQLEEAVWLEEATTRTIRAAEEEMVRRVRAAEAARREDQRAARMADGRVGPELFEVEQLQLVVDVIRPRVDLSGRLVRYTW